MLPDTKSIKYQNWIVEFIRHNKDTLKIISIANKS